MSELLQFLRDEAAQLVEAELPTAEETRPLVGAIVRRLERLEEKLIGEVSPPPEPQPEPVAVDVTSPEAVVSVEPPAEGPLSPAEQDELERLQARAQANTELDTTPPVEPAAPVEPVAPPAPELGAGS